MISLSTLHIIGHTRIPHCLVFLLFSRRASKWGGTYRDPQATVLLEFTPRTNDTATLRLCPDRHNTSTGQVRGALSLHTTFCEEIQRPMLTFVSVPTTLLLSPPPRPSTPTPALMLSPSLFSGNNESCSTSPLCPHFLPHSKGKTPTFHRTPDLSCNPSPPLCC